MAKQTELRFLEGNFRFGRYKLQYRNGVNDTWLDVPTVKMTKHQQKEYDEQMENGN